MKIRVLIVDDHMIFCEGLRGLLGGEPDMEVAGIAHNGQEAIEFASKEHPNVVLMDISMPAMNGILATRKIRQSLPECKVLALSMESDRRYIVEALDAGATGYLLKDTVFAELATAIRSVAADEMYLGPRISELIIKDYLMRIPDRLPLTFEALTDRELELVQLITDGKSSKEIATVLGVSIKTVEVHRHNIMKKLNLFSVVELTKYAIREGLTSVN